MLTAFYVAGCFTVITIASPTWGMMGISEQAKLWGTTASAITGAGLLVVWVTQIA